MDRKKEPHDVAQKKWIIFKYFNALRYKDGESVEKYYKILDIAQELI